MSKNLAFVLLLLALVVGFCSCRRTDTTRYLIVTETTHFEIRGTGGTLGLPLFPGTLGTEKIVRDVAQAEYYYQKLSSVYGQKSFVFLKDSTAEFLIDHFGEVAPPRPVYSYQNSDAKFNLELVSFKDNFAEYRFRATDASGKAREHSVLIPAGQGQSASIGMLLSPKDNRGVLVAMSVKSLAITPELTPDSLATFLREKNAPQSGAADSGYHAGDQRWMDVLFGAHAVKLPLAPDEPEEHVPIDVMPLPIGGMNAFSEHVIYPPSAMRDSLEGRVVVDISLSDSGEVIACKVLKGVRADLDSAALNAARAVKFTPAQYKGRPVAVHVAVPFAFKLKP